MDDPQSLEATDVIAPIVDIVNENDNDAKAASTKEQPQQPSPPQDEITKKSPSGTNSTRGAADDHSSDDNISVSSDITDVAIANPTPDYYDLGIQGLYEEDDANAAPGHLHALSRIPDARLRGLPRHNSDGKLLVTGGGGSSDGGGGRRRSRSTSRSRGGGRTSGRRSANSSRSSSPLPSSGNSGRQQHHYDGGETGSKAGGAGDASSTAYSTIGNHSVHSSGQLSSLDGIYDPDVLLDRLGFIDLDPPLPHEIRCGPLAAPGTIDGKSNNSGGLTPVNERLSEETLDDCHAFNDLVMIDNLKLHVSGGMSSTLSMPSVAHSSLSGMRSDMSVGSGLSLGSFKGGHSRGGSVAGGSLMGDGENSVVLGTLDEEGEDEVDC
mmetsp:Transcript_21965/g.47698  ORF Transcript_21965/g.47698 Transcript_21965/m.47698 type:complete len:380 (-) Transcript_21965:192-1331(-)|eukprot:CAMPEP_0172316656 /NCGR_PEP_ID=MMETSP1058-20130122/29014_1 /TAXON_ID=83371 /ORGANISM="Detonula confervacea, Strain CCMP 353" /LENGTH=379 /DNA_ID=CAMNT_0013031013 /DNA_START=102 /DNA_END=1241 /DNA_ORIENTATION=+